MDYNTLKIIPNEKKIIVKINSCKELAHRMDHSTFVPSLTALFEYVFVVLPLSVSVFV